MCLVNHRQSVQGSALVTKRKWNSKEATKEAMSDKGDAGENASGSGDASDAAKVQT